MKKVSSLQVLLPVKINPASSTECIKAAIEFYSDDLPNPNVFDEEFEVWKLKWLQAPLQQRPETLSKTLQQCSSASFPNIFTLLKLFATLPLSSCSCERSGSSLKRLNNFLRCTQSEERLSALAIIHCNYDFTINVPEVCKRFLEKHARKMNCPSLLFD